MGSYFFGLGALWAGLLGIGFGIQDVLPFDSESVREARIALLRASFPIEIEPEGPRLSAPAIGVTGLTRDALAERAGPIAVIIDEAVLALPRGLARDDIIAETALLRALPLSIDPALWQAPQACFVGTGEIDAEFSRMVSEAEADDCGFVPEPRNFEWHIAYNRSFSVRCDFAASLNAFEQRLDALAEEILGTKITRIEQVGTYSCRNTYGSPVGRPSEHARANAVDIAAFRLDDGRIISLAKHWGTDTPEGRFLSRLRDEACLIFNTVLSPDYNAAHRDHFHFDLGRHDMCR